MNPAHPSPAQLVVIEGKDKGKVIPLRNGKVIIGRAKADIIIQDSRISRSHVELNYDEKLACLTFTDLKSLNGTVINGKALETGQLKDGDKLQLGNTLLDCQIPSLEHTVPAGATHTELKTGVKRKEPQLPAAALQAFDERDAVSMAGPALDSVVEEVEKSIAEELEASISKVGAKEPIIQLPPETPPPPKAQPRRRFPTLPITTAKDAFAKLHPAVRATLIIFLVLAGYISLQNGPTRVSRELVEREVAALKLLETQGKMKEALIKAEELRKSFPDDGQTLMALGDLYLANQRMESAIEAYQKAKTAEPKPTLVHIQLSKAYLRAGYIHQAQEESSAIDKQIQSDPGNPEFMLNVGKLLLDHRELRQPAQKVFIVAKALQTTLAPQSPLGFQLEATQLLQENRFPEASALLERAYQKSPQDESILDNLAFTKLSMKDTVGAAKVVESWLKINPNATRALLVMSYLKFTDHNHLMAIPYLQKLIQILSATPSDPYLGEALHLMGLIYSEQNQKNEAESFLSKSCALGYQQSCTHPILTESHAANATKSLSQKNEPTLKPDSVPSITPLKEPASTPQPSPSLAPQVTETPVEPTPQSESLGPTTPE